jgi:hypothetical protein
MSFQGMSKTEKASIGEILIASRHAPGPSYRATEYLLGRIPSLSEPGNFTTQGPGSGV